MKHENNEHEIKKLFDNKDLYSHFLVKFTFICNCACCLQSEPFSRRRNSIHLLSKINTRRGTSHVKMIFFYALIFKPEES